MRPLVTEQLRTGGREHGAMREVLRDRFANSWLSVPLNVVVWAAVWGTIDLLLSDGGVLHAAVPGAAGGLAFGLVTYYARYRDREAT